MTSVHSIDLKRLDESNAFLSEAVALANSRADEIERLRREVDALQIERVNLQSELAEATEARAELTRQKLDICDQRDAAKRELAEARAVLSEIANTGKGMRPADRKQFMSGFVPREMRLARDYFAKLTTADQPDAAATLEIVENIVVPPGTAIFSQNGKIIGAIVDIAADKVSATEGER